MNKRAFSRLIEEERRNAKQRDINVALTFSDFVIKFFCSAKDASCFAVVIRKGKRAFTAYEEETAEFGASRVKVVRHTYKQRNSAHHNVLRNKRAAIGSSVFHRIDMSVWRSAVNEDRPEVTA